jgi:hypothetical protein
MHEVTDAGMKNKIKNLTSLYTTGPIGLLETQFETIPFIRATKTLKFLKECCQTLWDSFKFKYRIG